MRHESLNSKLGFDVSRETFGKLSRYHDLLLQWSKTHNLIGPKERDEIWTRHIVDCLGAWPLVEEGTDILDIGSGAGLPGLVLACCAKPDQTFILVESNAKRCAFLRHVGRELDLPIEVLNTRMENVSRETISHITARAVADLKILIQLSEKWLDKSGVAVFHKGRNWNSELTESLRYWSFNHEVKPSLSDPDGVILRISEVRRV